MLEEMSITSRSRRCHFQSYHNLWTRCIAKAKLLHNTEEVEVGSQSASAYDSWSRGGAQMDEPPCVKNSVY